VYFSGNFSAGELDDIAAQLPDRAAVRGRPGAPLTVGTMADTCYPVRGIFDPLGFLQGLPDDHNRIVYIRQKSGRAVFDGPLPADYPRRW
jgi:hypothetical protein